MGHGVGMLRLAASASVLLALLAGCASAEPTGSASPEVANADLGAKTVVKGSIAAGQTVKVDYAPATYRTNGLPYLALAFEADASAPVAHVTVGGDFPGTPHLLVVDSSFTVLAEADGVRTTNGAEATLALPATASAATMLLVQDPQWAVEMSFDVTAE